MINNFFENRIIKLIFENNIVFFIILLSILVAILETIGIGSVIPLIKIFSDPVYLDNLKELDKFDFLNKFDNKTLINIFFLIFPAIFIFKNLLYVTFIYLSSNFIANFRTVLSRRLYSNYIYTDYKFHLNNNASDLIKNINIDTENLRFSISFVILGISEIFIIISILTFLFIYNFILTGICILTILIIGIIYKLLLKDLSQKIGEDRFNILSKLQIKVKETLNNIKIIKIFSSHDYFLKNFDKSNIEYSDRLAKQDLILNLPKIIIELTMIFILFIFVFFNKDQSNFFSIAGVYLLAFFRLMPSLNRIATAYSFKDVASYTFNKITDLLNSSEIPPYKNNKIRDQNISKNINVDEISFKNVSYSYDEKFEIFNDMSIDFKKNEFIGITGNSGSGKTTFVNLLLGLLNPTKGSILINGKYEISKNLDLFKNKISYVPQSIKIQELTLAENIAFGVELGKIDYNKLYNVIKQANLKDLVEKLPFGIDTVIKDDNYNISGGELQRLGIARALYFNSEIIILDEATSSLDENNEKEIIRSIFELFYKKKTIIFISHKIINLKNADYLLEIKNSKIKKIFNK